MCVQGGGLDQTEAFLGAADTASERGFICPAPPPLEVGDPPVTQGGDDSMNVMVDAADPASEHSSSEGGHPLVDTAEDDPPQDGGLDQMEAVVGAADTASEPGSVCPTLPSVKAGDPRLLQGSADVSMLTSKVGVRRGREKCLACPCTVHDVAAGRPPHPGWGDTAARRYLLSPLCSEDAQLLSTVQLRCRSFRKVSDWQQHLDEGRVQSICIIDVKGLVKVVPCRDPGGKAGEFCINGFAIDHDSNLLHKRQCAYPKRCRLSILLKTHE